MFFFARLNFIFIPQTTFGIDPKYVDFQASLKFKLSDSCVYANTVPSIKSLELLTV